MAVVSEFAGRAMTPPGERAYSDWDVYRFGMSVGLRTLAAGPVAGLKRLINPVEYIRFAEFRYVLENLDVRPGGTVLDIASPKMLSLFLAARMDVRVHSTDLVDYFFHDYDLYADRMLGQNRDRFVIETQDARSLTHSDNSMDRVFSVSAIEHIPDDGDTTAMREIARVLKPGGLCCLTMPWCDRGYLEEYKQRGDPSAYWTDADSGAEKVFYQRAYDRKTMEQRIVHPSGMVVTDLSFWGERRFRVEHLMTVVPSRFIKWMLLPAHFYLNRLFLNKLGETEPSKKKIMCLTLRKPH